MTFEKYKERLSQISESLESGDLTLDESIKYYEESVKLSSECLKILNSKKGKITELKKQLGSLTEVAFSDSEGGDNDL